MDFTQLESITLPGVRVIERYAFFSEEGSSLRNITLPKVEVIASSAFICCYQLTEVEFSEDLQSVGNLAFCDCTRLRRIAIPLKDDLIDDGAFGGCYNLSQVDLVGGIHKTISSLLLESWRDEMNEEIGSINHDLPNIDSEVFERNWPDPPNDEKTVAIQNWLERVLDRIEHYKSEHYALLKKNTVLLELALWKANLPNLDAATSRHHARVTCGADFIIPHVLSFLNDGGVFPLLDPDIAKLKDASKRGDVTAVEALRESGVDIVGSRFKSGISSILLACLHGNVDLVRYLLDQGANSNDSENGAPCLMAAAGYAHPDCVSCLIDAGADVKYAYSGDNATIIYMTALCFSEPQTYYDFEEGHVIRTVQLLLDAGAPWNTPCDGRTALQLLQDMDMSAVDDKVEQERDGVIELLQSKLLELEELQSSESEYDEETSGDDNGSYDESEESDEDYSDDEMLYNLVRKRNHFL